MTPAAPSAQAFRGAEARAKAKLAEVQKKIKAWALQQQIKRAKIESTIG